MTPVIPTLTIDGWDTTPLSQMSKLWEYYQASDYSQSNTFIDKITSLKYTLKKSLNPDILIKNIEVDIKNLYGCYFDLVKPSIEVKELKGDTVRIEVEIEATLNTEVYKLSRAVHGKKSGVVEYETKLINKFKYDILNKG